MTRETAKTFGRPWGGGMGHLAETCGYLTGAVLVIAQAFIGCRLEDRLRIEKNPARTPGS